MERNIQTPEAVDQVLEAAQQVANYLTDLAKGLVAAAEVSLSMLSTSADGDFYRRPF